MIPNTSDSDQGVSQYQWRAFSQVAGADFAPLAATLTPTTVQIIPNRTGAGLQAATRTVVRYGCDTTLPAWLRVGTIVTVQASVDGESLSGQFVVFTVDPVNFSFTLDLQRTHPMFGVQMAVTALDATPSVTCSLVSQKAMLVVTDGTVTIAPCIDADGNAPYTLDWKAGDGEYELTAPTGGRHDLSDWFIKSAGSGTIGVRFL